MLKWLFGPRGVWETIEVIPVSEYPGHDWEFAKAYVLRNSLTGKIKVRRI